MTAAEKASARHDPKRKLYAGFSTGFWAVRTLDLNDVIFIAYSPGYNSVTVHFSCFSIHLIFLLT